MRKALSLFFIACLILKAQSQSLSTKEVHLINTAYHFSLTIPGNWGLLSKNEIEQLKNASNNDDLKISALAYLGNKKYFDDLPHLYVLFYPQPKFGELGFAYSSKLILSSYVRGFVEKEMNKKFTDWSFKLNENDYNVDTVKRMVMFSSSTKYNDGHTGTVIYCYFLMTTGAAEIDFSVDKPTIDDYVEILKQVWNSVHIDSEYILKKD